MAVTTGGTEGEAMRNAKILLTAAEVAELTGFAVGSIRHFVSQRRIPFVRISARCVRFRRSDVEVRGSKTISSQRLATTRGESGNGIMQGAQKNRGCLNCGEVREIAAHGLCFKCYRRRRARERPEVCWNGPPQSRLAQGAQENVSWLCRA